MFYNFNRGDKTSVTVISSISTNESHAVLVITSEYS